VQILSPRLFIALSVCLSLLLYYYLLLSHHSIHNFLNIILQLSCFVSLRLTNLLLSGVDEPQALIVLAEEEIVAIDLVSENWPTFPLPYLVSLHCSAITCTAHVANVPKTLWDKMADAGRLQGENVSSRVSIS